MFSAHQDFQLKNHVAFDWYIYGGTKNVECLCGPTWYFTYLYGTIKAVEWSTVLGWLGTRISYAFDDEWSRISELSNRRGSIRFTLVMYLVTYAWFEKEQLQTKLTNIFYRLGYVRLGFECSRFSSLEWPLYCYKFSTLSMTLLLQADLGGNLRSVSTFKRFRSVIRGLQHD